jgi:hypothetical protein
MKCPHIHTLYELERGTLPREEADVLRRHAAECEDCRAASSRVGRVAAVLEQLAGGLRHDLPDGANEAILRRARAHGYMGGMPRRPLAARWQTSPWLRIGVPVGLAAAVVAAVILGLYAMRTPEIRPEGSLQYLVRGSADISRMDEIRPLAKAAQAAVSEELARPSPSLDQVGDLLLVAYIAHHPKEQRQVDDVRFLVQGVWSRRVASEPQESAAAFRGSAIGPMLASLAMAQAVPASDPADPLERARLHILGGDYAGALAALPADSSATVLRAWCLTLLGRLDEAAETVAEGDSGLIRLMRADVALRRQDVEGALKGFESAAEVNNRFWFAAGYVCRYELADARSAGLRFQKVKDRELAAYVAKKFQGELMAAKDRVQEPMALLVESFDSYDLGPLASGPTWALVQTRDREFQVVQGPQGKVLEQDEVNFRGAEFLTEENDWSDYTLQTKICVLEAHGNYAVGAAAYRKADHTGYVLELSPSSLRLVKQSASRQRGSIKGAELAERMPLASEKAKMRLAQPPATGWWYMLKIRVQKVVGGTEVSGKCWRSDEPEPAAWQVSGLDKMQGDSVPLTGGAAGVQISGAKVQIDNLMILRNAPADPVRPAQAAK